MQNKIFLFKINFEHYRTGELMSTKIGIIKAKNKETAKELIWQNFGSDNATLSDGDIIDISNQNYASIEVHYPRKNNY